MTIPYISIFLSVLLVSVISLVGVSLLTLGNLFNKKLMLSLLKAEEDERAQRLVEHEDIFK